MIIGVGIDLIEVERFRDYQDGAKSCPFTHSELRYCYGKRYPERHLAARFAAKEAFFKAIGTGARTPGEFVLIEVVLDDAGNPSLRVTGIEVIIIGGLSISRVHLSLTHTGSTAGAVVILEG